MRIAIIGAGFAGLAVAYHLLKISGSEITLFDGAGIGGEASGIAAGLLHTFTGPHAKLTRYGLEGMKSTFTLLEKAQQAHICPVYNSSGMLRLALTPQQEVDFNETATKNKTVTYLTAEECQKLTPSISPFPGIFIKDALTVYTKEYLTGLFHYLSLKGVKFQKTAIKHLIELNTFDKIIVTAGASTKNFHELDHLQLSYTKGQILELEWPKNLPLLKLPVNSESYIVMNQDNTSCIVGATFEKHFINSQPDEKEAQAYIMPKITAIIPGLKKAKIISCKAGIRVATPGHLPLVQKINDCLCVFVGLGSKGLLYHSLYAEKICDLINSRT
jgi:glycine/D-amino acid oxidase-like deaminating enzyme